MLVARLTHWGGGGTMRETETETETERDRDRENFITQGYKFKDKSGFFTNLSLMDKHSNTQYITQVYK